MAAIITGIPPAAAMVILFASLPVWLGSGFCWRREGSDWVDRDGDWNVMGWFGKCNGYGLGQVLGCGGGGGLDGGLTADILFLFF